MEQTIYNPGAEIIKVGDHCHHILFVVNGLVDVQIVDGNQNKTTIDTLKQGDLIGQYSVINGDEFEFAVQARTNVRVLYLTREFINYFTNEDLVGDRQIEGFMKAISRARTTIQKFGVPICDFKVFDIGKCRKCTLKEHSPSHRSRSDLLLALKRASIRAIAISQSQKKSSQPSIVTAFKQLVQVKNLKRRQAHLKTMKKESTTEYKELEQKIDEII